MSNKIAKFVTSLTRFSDRGALAFAAGWTLIAWLAAAFLDGAGGLGWLDRAVMDRTASLSAPPPAADDIVVVAIDALSFQDVGQPWPWRRNLHADLLDAADEAGARAVVFDIVFDTETQDDAQFAEAISDFGDVVLAVERSLIRSDYGLIETEAGPTPALATAAAFTGLASIPLDGDGRIRKMPAQSNALAYATAGMLNAEWSPAPPNSFIRFRRDGFPKVVSYYQALQPDTHLPEGFLKDKILLVGLALAANPTAGASGDAVFLPDYVAGDHLLPGVLAQAQVLATARAGDAIRPAPAPFFGSAIALAFAASIGLLFVMRHSVKWGVAGLGALLSLIAALAWLTYGAGWVWAPGGILTGATFAVLGQLTVFGGSALAARRRLAAGFARYVSPEIMKRILNSKQPPKLGGELREVSVIVTDLEGFTQLMESLDAEQGAAILRDYLDMLGATVLQHGGLIDQFIGDSVVALFNAPLDQPDHAEKAAACVVALDQAARAHRDQLARRGIHLGTTRIGAASGMAMVGNFGARNRFHYTAMGDVVNTASRLEAANKDLGTRALITEKVFDQAGRPDAFGAPRDITLRGKSAPIRAVALQDE